MYPALHSRFTLTDGDNGRSSGVWRAGRPVQGDTRPTPWRRGIRLRDPARPRIYNEPVLVRNKEIMIETRARERSVMSRGIYGVVDR